MVVEFLNLLTLPSQFLNLPSSQPTGSEYWLRRGATLPFFLCSIFIDQRKKESFAPLEGVNDEVREGSPLLDTLAHPVKIFLQMC